MAAAAVVSCEREAETQVKAMASPPPHRSQESRSCRFRSATGRRGTGRVRPSYRGIILKISEIEARRPQKEEVGIIKTNKNFIGARENIFSFACFGKIV
jgi:hypothetical protein